MWKPVRVDSAEVLSAHRSEDVQGAVARLLACSRSDDTLIRRAAAGLAVVCADVLRERRGGVNGRRVVLLVGTGNNGADALLAGVHLRSWGARVEALLVGGEAYRPGLAALNAGHGITVDARSGEGRTAALSALAAADLVVDGIVGDRGAGGLRSPADELVAAIPVGVPVVAVDLPSGVDPDTGEISGPHVHADVTVTFGSFKPCLFLPPASHAAGRLEFVDVGLTDELPAQPLVRRLTRAGAAARWPVPARTEHKYTRGVLGVIAGSDTYPGAAVLAALGAVRAGVGIVRYIGPPRVTDHVLMAAPEAVPGFGRVQAWLLGSGVESDPDQDEAIGQALDSGLPCVVDAGALEECVKRRAAGARSIGADGVLMTPHAGELARMLDLLGHEVTRGDVETRPMFHALWLAREVDATVLLKGPTTLIASPSGWLFSQNDGPSWLATAGSGDVLAGIAGALMASGVGAMDAGAMSALVHGLAGARASGGGPISAGQIAEATPATVADLLRLLSEAQSGGRPRRRLSANRR
ncbi:bifunctional ADP-dependent NAD(P)H-hydrate dehydratase/NAD(P)H-hydrate epimerase [Planosporangium sp. 12N6]|uniref:bifunctional ADP-dependent NAD(P)H-hydrate dehydratase/NAD(P)H-hydrate epimerase n=1 Tax=Planosporangium spinosum TaxID=3402278 RepID=UPI003CF655E7